MSKVGTIVRGIRTGVIKEGDDLVNITVSSVIEASKEEKFELQDKDIVAITEAVVGISNGNYVTVDDIAEDVSQKFKTKHIGIVFPILSRNRFAVLLSAFARSMEKITMLLSYPSDEVGNDILDKNKLRELNIPLSNYTMTEEEYTNKFGDFKHIFTGVNMVDFYRDLAKSENCEIEFVFSNNPETILNYTDKILCADIHTRNETKTLLKNKGASLVLGLDDIMTTPINGSGCNPEYGLLGSNRATEEKVKLFPTNCQTLVENIQEEFKKQTGKTIEVMVYGDGAFKDPVGKIWELADPVVSPGYTSGLEGSPNELKLKYLSDNKFSNLKGEELNEAIKKEIIEKNKNLKGTIETQGTTPRRYTDLIGSLCDLTSGSGDKGTPVVLVQNYFKNYAD
jgi:F420-0:gamma-glutamyl ligase